METQARDIQHALEKEGWVLIETERPISETYWWVWEFWHFRRNDHKIVLSFLIDPGCDRLKNKKDVWAVKASLDEPIDRNGTPNVAFISIGRNWKKELPTFVSEICRTDYSK